MHLAAVHWLTIPAYILDLITTVVVVLGLVIAFSPELMRIDRDLLAGPSVEQDSPREERFGAGERRRTRTRMKLSLVQHLPIFMISGLMILVVLEMVVSTPLKPKGIYVSLAAPQAAIAPANSEPALVVQVQLVRDRHTYTVVCRVQGQAVSEGEIAPALKRELARRSPWVVYIYGDDDVPFSAVAQVVDVVNGLGARPVLVGRSRPSKGS
jgi:biopolymer transport protein ExbD